MYNSGMKAMPTSIEAGERTHENFEAKEMPIRRHGRQPNTNAMAGSEKGWSVVRCECVIGMQCGYDTETYSRITGNLNYRQAEAVAEIVAPWMWSDADECRMAIFDAICQVVAGPYHPVVAIDSAYDGVEVFAPFSGVVSVGGEYMAEIDINTDGSWHVTDGEVAKSYRLSVDRQVREFLEMATEI